LELVGLGEYADRSVVALSGGQMQRVALARSLSYRPSLLLLDEPLSNLDAKLRIRLRDDLRKIIKEAGVTALYVTHDQAEAVVIGDRIGVMKDGELLQHDAPAALYNDPHDMFVAGFTGADAMLTVELRDNGHGGLDAYVEGQDKRLVTLPGGPATRPGTAQVAIRPENVKLHKTSDTPEESHHEARIHSRQYLGTQTLYTVRFFGQAIDIVELGTSPRFDEGEAVLIEFPVNCIKVFNTH